VFTSLTRIIPVKDELFFQNLLKKISLSNKGDFKRKWLAEYSLSEKKHYEFLENSQWSDLKAHELISKAIPKETIVQLGNSTSVRYVQLFSCKPSLNFYGNRGVSGIDGSTSTALGSAIASKKNTVLITGDLSFVYDNNALWNNYLPSNLKIIILNNDGGGIFKIIPGPSDSQFFEENFVSNNPSSIELLAKAHNVNYLYCESETQTVEMLSTLFDSHEATILEIKTSSCDNSEILTSYFKKIKS
jgi:2-succinyl-5-enolpyruvyl-6-hydroxy-3-cyclohexene-1-carboxylate synthase